MKILWRSLCGLLLLLALRPSVRAQSPAPVYVTLWFDTEDYILPRSDDAAKQLAEMLTRLGVTATFKIVGEKARTLERRGRRDVLDTLKRHEIGYHADLHSGQPTIAVYLQNTGWEDGAREFERRESPGVRDIERIFGRTPICYGQPGSAWASQTYPALRRMGIKMYLDESSHVGIDEQPFYYGGMLNVLKMHANVARMELKGGDSLSQGKAKFKAAYDKLQAQGGGTISIYYHPCEFVHTEFWDTNFKWGANPPRADWKLPGVRPEAEIKQSFADFEQYIKFIQAQPAARFVTCEQLLALYADLAQTKLFGLPDMLPLARANQSEITFQSFRAKLDGKDSGSLSAADSLWLLTQTAMTWIKGGRAQFELMNLAGPTHVFTQGAGSVRPDEISGDEFAEMVRGVDQFCRTHGRVPDEIWIAANNISPQDYLATVAAAVDVMLTTKQLPVRVKLRAGRFTADQYIAEDSPKLWGWIIFPEGFHAPKIMELARLQAWTLKPALLQQ